MSGFSNSTVGDTNWANVSTRDYTFSPEHFYAEATYYPLNITFFNCSSNLHACLQPRTDLEDDSNGTSSYNGSRESMLDQLNEVVEFRVAMLLVTWVLPVVVLVGVVGNAVSLWVLLRRGMRRTSACRYLACLSVADSTVLLASAFKTWIRVVFGVELLHLSAASCKILIFLTHLSLTAAAWLIVAVTLERFLAVWLPLRATEVCNVGRTRIVIAAVIVLLALVNSHVLWTAELVRTSPQSSTSASGVMCTSYAYETLVCRVFPWVYLALYCFLPAVLLLCLNSLILYKLFQHRQSITGGQAAKTSNSTSLRNHYPHQYHHHHHHPIQHANLHNPRQLQTQTAQQRLPVCGSHTKLLQQLSQTSSQSRFQPQTPQQFHRRLAPMLLGVSFAWLFLTTPQTMYNLTAPMPGSIKETGQQYLVKTIFFLLMYINHALNFFLYCVTGQRFRQELRRGVTCDPDRRIRLKQTFLHTCMGNGRDGSSENGAGDSPLAVEMGDAGGIVDDPGDGAVSGEQVSGGGLFAAQECRDFYEQCGSHSDLDSALSAYPLMERKGLSRQLSHSKTS